jgi:hypothetical protein
MKYFINIVMEDRCIPHSYKYFCSKKAAEKYMVKQLQFVALGMTLDEFNSYLESKGYSHRYEIQNN